MRSALILFIFISLSGLCSGAYVRYRWATATQRLNCTGSPIDADARPLNVCWGTGSKYFKTMVVEDPGHSPLLVQYAFNNSTCRAQDSVGNVTLGRVGECRELSRIQKYRTYVYRVETAFNPLPTSRDTARVDYIGPKCNNIPTRIRIEYADGTTKTKLCSAHGHKCHKNPVNQNNIFQSTALLCANSSLFINEQEIIRDHSSAISVLPAVAIFALLFII